MSVKDQMRISQEYNRKSPEEKKKAVKKALGGIPKGKKEKQRQGTMADAYKSMYKGALGSTKAD